MSGTKSGPENLVSSWQLVPGSVDGKTPLFARLVSSVTPRSGSALRLHWTLREATSSRGPHPHEITNGTDVLLKQGGSFLGPVARRLLSVFIMDHSEQSPLSRFRRSPARTITVIQTDGTVIRTTEAAARLNDLITETLASYPLRPTPAGEAPIDLSIEDLPSVGEDLSLALEFARKAS